MAEKHKVKAAHAQHVSVVNHHLHRAVCAVKTWQLLVQCMHQCLIKMAFKQHPAPSSVV